MSFATKSRTQNDIEDRERKISKDDSDNSAEAIIFFKGFKEKEKKEQNEGTGKEQV